MGIPARYAEGYVFTYEQVVLDGTLVENADYERYYSGYSPIGETALVEIEVSDASAHAWVEMYVDGEGWVVFDPTPAADGDDERASFWEDFLNRGTESEDLFLRDRCAINRRYSSFARSFALMRASFTLKYRYFPVTYKTPAAARQSRPYASPPSAVST